MKCIIAFSAGAVLTQFVGPGAARAATPLGAAFIYQGQLKVSGLGVNGPTDFEFTLWDDATSAPGLVK